MEACDRCGTFAELQTVAGKRYCAACAARPAVLSRDWYAGQRDVWSWLMGFAAAASFVIAFVSLDHLVQTGVWAALGVSQLMFRLGKPWARPLCAVLPVAGLATSALEGHLNPMFFWPLFLTLAAWRDPVNRLYFQLHVSDEDLRHLAERTENNELARVAQSLAIASLLVPLLWPFALFMGWLGLKSADPAANPPVGKGPAWRALLIALSVPVVLIAVSFVLAQLSSFLRRPT